MRRISYILCCLAVAFAAGTARAQTPKFRDLPPQQYYVATPIAPLAPDIRSASGPIPKNVYGQVTTIAGSGSAGFNNAKGKLASFNHPIDVKLDAAGNLYVADEGNNAIRKIALDGTVTTFAGNGSAGYLEGQGTGAKFDGPTAMVFDAGGNLYVTDKNNQVIRKITPGGLVSLFAGTPGVAGKSNNIFRNPQSITIDLNGQMYVGDGNYELREVHFGYVVNFAGFSPSPTYYGDINGPGARATIGVVSNLATGPDGNMYFTNGELIRKVTSSAVASTAAGVISSKGAFDGDSRTAVFENTYGITLATAGTIFISDEGNQLIRRFGRREDFISKLAGSSRKNGNVDAVGDAARFNNPAGMCVDDAGFVYVADADNNSIRKISSTGYKIFPEKLPTGLVFDATTGTITGTPTVPWPATDYNIFGYNVDGQGQYLVNIQVNEAQRQPQVITFAPIPVKKQTDPDFVVTPTSSNTSPGAAPIVLTSSRITVASISDGKIHIIGPGKTTITATQQGNPFYYDAEPVTRELIVTEVPPVIVYPTITPKQAPILVPLDTTGNVKASYTQFADVTGEYNSQKKVITLKDSLYNCSHVGPQNAIVSAGFGADPADPLSAQFNYPSNIVFDASSGKMYVADKGNYRLRLIDAGGRVRAFAGSGRPGKEDGEAGLAGFSRELLTITTGPDGSVYVCDIFNASVRKITPDGTVSTFAYETLIPFNDYDPLVSRAVAVDKDGYIYVSDNTHIYKVAPDGNSATVFAGSGKELNNDGTGAAADFNGITGLYFANNGDLYVASSGNDYNALRKVTPGGVTTTIYIKSDPLLRFTRLVVDSKGNAFVASSEPKIYKITPSGVLSIFAGSASRIGAVDGDGPTVASFNNPQGIGIDPQDNLYIADQDNHRIRKITPNGLVTTIAGSGIAGYFDNIDQSNKTSKVIPFFVTSPITITSTYKPVVIPYLDVCPALVPDYTKTATAKSSCANRFTFTQTPAAGTILSNGQTVNLVLTAHDNLSPYDDGSITFTITANKLPTPSVTISPGFIDTCARFEVTYTATPKDEGLHPDYKWYVNGVEKYSGGPEFTSSTLSTGDKITCVVTNNDGCAPISSAPSAPATINAAASVTTSVNIFAQYTGAVCRGSLLSFRAVPTNVQTGPKSPSYQWQINGVTKSVNSADFSTTSLNDGDIVTCTMTSTGKCVFNPTVTSNPITAQLLPDADCDIVVPNTFTPNGDGVNDYWQIPVLKNYPNSTISIFNRYGKLLYQSTGYSKPWDGVFQGKALPAGTYYYMVNTHTYRAQIAGWVTILR